jgi:hypothetical protein
VSLKHFGTLIVFVAGAASCSVGFATAETAADKHFEALEIESLLRTDSIGALDIVVQGKIRDQEKAKSCAFQNAHDLPPTFCFRSDMSSEERQRLSDTCVARARRARAIPAFDKWTEPACRQSLEERRRDLLYSRS